VSARSALRKFKALFLFRSKPMESSEVYLKYTGVASLDGVPARDLTYAEALQYGEARLLNSGLYTKAKVNKSAKPNYEDKERKS
jgi:hypothetical protein